MKKEEMLINRVVSLIHNIFKRVFFVYSFNALKNQSVGNAVVAFVKGAGERNKFFDKNKQSVMYDE